MALTKVTYGLLSADTSAIDLNIDANTLYVDSSANKVGIGTNSPAQALHVVSAANQIRIEDSTNNKKYDLNVDGNSFMIDDMTAGANRFTILTGGNVGIGTTSPDRQLELEGQGVLRLNATGSDTDPGIDFNTSSTNDMQFRYRGASDTLAVYSYGTTSDVFNIKKATGRVGIGTTSPGHPLHINSSDTIHLKLSGTATSGTGIYIDNDRTGSKLFGILVGNIAAGAFSIKDEDAGATRFVINSSGSITFNQAYTFPTSDGSANQVLQTDGSGALSFTSISSSDNTKLPLSGGTLTGGVVIGGDSSINRGNQTSGELLIGGTTDGGFVDFDGTSLQLNTQRDPNTGTFINTGKSNARIELIGADGNAHIKFRTTASNNTSATERMRIHASGCVGVGSTADRSLGTNIGTLVVNGSAGGGLWLSPGDSSAMSSKIYAQANGSVGDLIINNGGSNPGGIRIQMNGSEKILVHSNGRVGIGTTGGNAGVHVANGDIRCTSAAFANDANSISMSWESSGIGYLTARGPSTSERGKLGLSVNRSNGAAGITGLLIDNDGAVLINTTVNAESQAMRIRQGGSNANAALSLDSDTGDQSYYRYMRFYRKGQTSSVAKLDIDWSGSSIGLSFTSDARLKTVTGEADGLELITRLNPVKYVWKSEPDREGAQGFLAQEVEQAYYETGNSHARGVSRPIDGEKWYMLDDTTLIPNLVKAIKELKDENDALKARVEALES